MTTRIRVKNEKGHATQPVAISMVLNGGEQRHDRNQHIEANGGTPNGGDQHQGGTGYGAPDQSAGEAHVDQTPDTRRILRANYRSIKESIAVDKESLMQAHSGTFKSVIGEVESLHSLVQRPLEQIADAEAVLDISSTLLDFIKGARHKDGVTPAEFVNGLIHSFGMAELSEQSQGKVTLGQENGSVIDWERLGLQATSVLCEAPGLCTMLGPMDIQPKQRKTVTMRKKQQRPAGFTHPEEVEDVSEADRKTETDKNMETMFKILRTLRSVQLEALVLNRNSFSQTVENIFALSFLVKDGRAEITYEHDGRHIVVPRNAPTAQERAGGKVINSQFVFRFDFEDWKLMQESLAEGKELMPHRTISFSGQRASVTPIRKNSRNRARETPVGLRSLAVGNGPGNDGDHHDDCYDPVTSVVPKKPRSRLFS